MSHSEIKTIKRLDLRAHTVADGPFNPNEQLAEIAAGIPSFVYSGADNAPSFRKIFRIWFDLLDWEGKSRPYRRGIQ